MTERRQHGYRDIEEWLRTRCAALAPGALLPSEAELCERFSVSRMTARQAVENLARDGLVERRRGAGTFVAIQPLHRQKAVLLSFTQDMKQRGMVPTSKLIDAQVTIAPTQASLLGLRPDSWLVCIDRIRYADAIPLARERVALPAEFADVLGYDLEHGSLHAALADMGRQLGQATGYVAARLATDEDAALLDLQLPAPLLVESRLIHDVNGRAVEATETTYVASRWVIDTGSFSRPGAASVTDQPPSTVST